jgi:hypothetical protein
MSDEQRIEGRGFDLDHCMDAAPMLHHGLDGARRLIRQNLAAVEGRKAAARAMAWARSAAGTPYGGTEVVSAAQKSGTVPDLPDQSIPRLRGGDACG